VRLATIAAAAEQIKAKSFMIDGEAVVPGADSLPRFRREAAAAHPTGAHGMLDLVIRQVPTSSRETKVKSCLLIFVPGLNCQPGW
jgi:hypothetical protein